MTFTNPTEGFLLADHYDYQLPKELIAQEPLPNREDARLMTINRADCLIDHHHIRDLDQLLRPGDCLVLNNTRVIPAKLIGFRTSTRGRWQGLFLESDEQGNWRMLCKTRGRIEPGETVTLQDREGNERMMLRLLARLDDGSWVGKPEMEGEWEDLLKSVGRVPLPNYIRDGNMTDADQKDYQTVFAKSPGAVAAPTAGLHLTERLLRRLIDVGVRIAQVTLHVGIGTFRPVKAEHLGDHEMHFERGSIDEKSVQQIVEAKQAGGRVIGIGTTSVRVLETAAADGELKPWSGETNLFIKPPYQIKVVDGLLTNFHLPRSTLLVMIRTFGGDQLMTRAYEAAIEEKYRFYSYGDAMLII
ncbi:MAG: tRNA preQ1(34) S-adenosylmethionine ribosyltransferase-isomerase QueA [Planctomycetota bacterium]